MTDGRDIWAIVPIKEIDGAKQRLAGRYSPEFRRGLALAMCGDVLAALASARGLAGIAVVTLDPDAAALARHHGAVVFDDEARSGHTGAVMAATRRLVREGRAGLLTVPGDIPLATTDEITRLVAAHPVGRTFTIVPARDRRGSNAILMTPPDAVPLAFGDDSFKPHLESARRMGLEPNVLELEGIGLDIDTPEDLDAFMRGPSPTRTWAFLSEEGLMPGPS